MMVKPLDLELQSEVSEGGTGARDQLPLLQHLPEANIWGSGNPLQQQGQQYGGCHRRGETLRSPSPAFSAHERMTQPCLS